MRRFHSVFFSFTLILLTLANSAAANVYAVHGGRNCPDKPCAAGEQCYIDEVQCKKAPCPSRMWCEAGKPRPSVLPPVLSTPRAHGAGSAVGICEKNSCPSGQKCVLIEVHCVSAPCPPMQQCVTQ